MAFYGQALGATGLFKMRFKDAPGDPSQPMPPHTADKIMYATMVIGSTMY